MSTKSVNFRIDEKLKRQSEQVLSEMGLTMSSAITLFLKQVVNKREIPFTIQADPFYSEENQKLLADRLAKYEAGIKVERDILE